MDTAHHKRTLYALALLVLVLALYGSSSLAQGLLSDFTGSLDRYLSGHRTLGAAAFSLLAGLSVLLGPFTSVPLVPSAVRTWGIAETLALLLLGWVLGSSAAYAVGRLLGETVVKKIVGETKLADWVRTLDRRLSFPLLLLFRLATPSETGYIFGVLRYRFGRYLLLTLLAELPFALIAVYAGDAFARSGWGSFAQLVTAWVLLTGGALWLFKREAGR